MVEGLEPYILKDENVLNQEIADCHPNIFPFPQQKKIK